MHVHAKKRRSNAGFSLVELMVVIVIIGILGSFVALKLLPKAEEARQVQAVHDIKQISDAIRMFYLKKNRLPESLEEIADDFSNGVPKDPWNTDYIYEVNSRTKFDIISLGRDGEEGGEGPDQDINRTWKKNQEEE